MLTIPRIYLKLLSLEELDVLSALLVETILLLIVLFDISFKLLMSVDVLLTSTVLTSVLVSSSLLQPEKQIVVNKIRKNSIIFFSYKFNPLEVKMFYNIFTRNEQKNTKTYDKH